jgi:hypothetical protein
LFSCMMRRRNLTRTIDGPIFETKCQYWQTDLTWVRTRTTQSDGFRIGVFGECDMPFQWVEISISSGMNRQIESFCHRSHPMAKQTVHSPKGDQ